MTPAPPAVPTVFISAYRNFSTRYILYSDIFAEFRKRDARFVLFFKDDDVASHRARFAADNVVVEPVLYGQASKLLKGGNPLMWTLGLVRRLMSGSAKGYENTTDAATLLTYADQKRSSLGRILFPIARTLARLGKRWRCVRLALLRLETALFPGRFYDAYFEKYQPALLVVSSIGYMIDPYFMRAARRHGTRVVSIIHSWDNTTTKDYRGGDPDHVITWNEIMRKEVEVFHDVPKERIHVGGIAHWDFYFDGSLRVRPRDEFLRAYGLDPARRLLFYGTSSYVLYKHSFRVAEELLQAIEAGRFCQPAQLLVRLHPQYLLPEGSGRPQVVERYRDEIARLSERYAGLVRFNLPDLPRLRDDIDMPVSDMHDLAEILTHSDVLVNEYSTLMIEAAVFDKPIVNVGLYTWRDTAHPFSILETYTHIRRILKTGAARSAYTLDELLAAVDAYLADPARDRDQRLALVEQEIPHNRGTAGRKIAELLGEILDGRVQSARG